MIPLSYTLRQDVRVEELSGAWRVICELPLGVMRVNEAAARLLDLTRPGVSVEQLAAGLSLDEERVLRLCEYFRAKGLLDVSLPVGDPAFAPTVSVIIPCKDRESELEGCLFALEALDYPPDKLEIIVVDDGSRDGTVAAAARHSCRILRNERNRGQSHSRNRAAAQASGELLAFIDSDCVAQAGWLLELVPYFAWPKVAAVGGFVAGYDEASRLDRYELVMSSLNMGGRLLLGAEEAGGFYVPTCNLLVRREAFVAAGGIREDLRVGEDVDLCWRLRKAGGYLVYSPSGMVQHRHRSHLVAMLRRRAEYGTSEALLHELHPEKRKRFLLPRPAFLTFACLAAGLLVHPWLLMVGFLPPLIDGLRRSSHLARESVAVRPSRLWFAVLRGHLSFLYFMLFHLVRYYLVVLLAGGVLYQRLWLLAGFALLYTAMVDYAVKRPRLGFAAFLFFYAAEHAAYQLGVVAGCLRRRTFRSYRVSLARERGGRPGASPLSAEAGVG